MKKGRMKHLLSRLSLLYKIYIYTYHQKGVNCDKLLAEPVEESNSRIKEDSSHSLCTITATTRSQQNECLGLGLR